MSTRKRKGFSNSNTPKKSSLPPSRKSKASAQHKTTPPFSGVRFSTFIYILSGLALSFIAFNFWRMLQLKTATGGWWPLLGRSAFRAGGAGSSRGYNTKDGRGEYGEKNGVENLIVSLAEALDVPSHELASAVAEAVKNHAPPQSLSSISAFGAMHTMTAIKDPEELPTEGVGDRSTAFAGFDDPVMD
ncbi:hypothetical protein JB92DRAFT_208369 [Gautieria morchelliformis]|nr:hypothetical protein JB92DRAFT_208369 [Gautieria morchelliformis]